MVTTSSSSRGNEGEVRTLLTVFLGALHIILSTDSADVAINVFVPIRSEFVLSLLQDALNCSAMLACVNADRKAEDCTHHEVPILSRQPLPHLLEYVSKACIR